MQREADGQAPRPHIIIIHPYSVNGNPL